jgi:hypothetical protein
VKSDFVITESGDGRICVTIEDEAHPIYFDDLRHLPRAIMLKEITAAVHLIRTKRRYENVAATVVEASEILSHTAATEVTNSRPLPPAIAQTLIALFAQERFADAQLGDMQEIFETNVKRHGLQRAKRLYWLEVLRSVGPIFFHWLKRIGFIAVLVDYGRKKMGL